MRQESACRQRKSPRAVPLEVRTMKRHLQVRLIRTSHGKKEVQLRKCGHLEERGESVSWRSMVKWINAAAKSDEN